ncbi:MAG: NUDIX domain-containing protein [Candidatus Falkowbacteria bacterium]|nr:NUDIX domain-containing protein [Candidatus Falkowbacteria bacterium]
MLLKNGPVVFTVPPIDFKRKFEAVSCYLLYREYILFLKRSDEDDSEPGKLGVPTGKRRSYEVDIDTGVREVKEETGIDLSKHKNRFIFSNQFYMRYEKFDFSCRTYVMHLLEKPTIVLSSEHQAYDWYKLGHVLCPTRTDVLVKGLKEVLICEERLVHEIISKAA